MGRRDFDIVVVGGGPAGLATSIAASRKGFRVLVADRARPPIDKVCGEGLMPDGVTALKGLGISVAPEHGMPFYGIRFLSGKASMDAAFPSGYGLGIRRTRLQEILLQSAFDAGVAFSWGIPVTGVSDGAVHFGADAVSCRWIVGADGQESSVRKWAGLSAVRMERFRFGFNAHYKVAPWTNFVEVYWAGGFQVVITPVGCREVCAALSSRNSRFRLKDALAALPGLWERLKGGVPTGRERGAVSVVRVLKSVARNHIALVGDASGSVDPLTGEGLCQALSQALSLADALERGDLSCYAGTHRRLSKMPVMMSKLILAMDKHAYARKRMLRVLGANPKIFTRLVEAHIGSEAPTAAIFSCAFRLGCGFLAG